MFGTFISSVYAVIPYCKSASDDVGDVISGLFSWHLMIKVVNRIYFSTHPHSKNETSIYDLRTRKISKATSDIKKVKYQSWATYYPILPNLIALDMLLCFYSVMYC